MNRRLLVSYASLVLFVLVALEVPLALSYARNERTALENKVERDAVAIGSLTEGALERPRETPLSRLQPIAVRYQNTTGARVVIVQKRGKRGIAVADSKPVSRDRDFSSRPEIAQALRGHVAKGVRYSFTLGESLLYVSVPVASGGVVKGAVRITYSTSAVDSRVHRYWLILGGIGAIVFALALLLGAWLARWISRPLRQVEEAAMAAGEGDLAARAPTQAGPPEVRALARAINDTVVKLEQLLRSQQEFVADASHELRTPLTALRLRLENLEHDVPRGGRDALAGALGEADRLARLVDGLLALVRADAGTPGGEKVDLDEAIRDRLTAWEHLASECDVQLRLAGRAELEVRVAPERLDQMLDNLISNALNVSPPGSAVTVSAARADDWIEVHVVDEGPGLGPDERRRAFDRFWTAGDGTAGSGLGLAIVQRLVEAEGGEVELLAAEGGGIDAVVRLRPAGRAVPARSYTR